MQTVVVFQKSNRKLLATFKLNRFSDMEVLKIPGVEVLVTYESDIFYVKNNEYYVKENVQNKLK